MTRPAGWYGPDGCPACRKWAEIAALIAAAAAAGPPPDTEPDSALDPGGGDS